MKHILFWIITASILMLLGIAIANAILFIIFPIIDNFWMEVVVALVTFIWLTYAGTMFSKECDKEEENTNK